MDHCQLNEPVGHYAQERKDINVMPLYTQTTVATNSHEEDTNVYDDIIQNGDEMTSIGSQFLGVEKSTKSQAQAQMSNRLSGSEGEAQSIAHPENLHMPQQFLVNSSFELCIAGNYLH